MRVIQGYFPHQGGGKRAACVIGRLKFRSGSGHILEVAPARTAVVQNGWIWKSSIPWIGRCAGGVWAAAQPRCCHCWGVGRRKASIGSLLQPGLLVRHPELHYLVVGGPSREGDMSRHFGSRWRRWVCRNRVHFLGPYHRRHLKWPSLGRCLCPGNPQRRVGKRHSRGDGLWFAGRGH